MFFAIFFFPCSSSKIFLLRNYFAPARTLLPLHMFPYYLFPPFIRLLLFPLIRNFLPVRFPMSILSARFRASYIFSISFLSISARICGK